MQKSKKSKAAAVRKPTAAGIAKMLAKLTPAQLQVFKEILSGDDVETIATRLDRSPMTVNNHLREIYGAFDLHSRAKIMALFVVPPPLPKH